jgi:MFS family permease
MNRWSILIGYSFLAASTQILWITFAPITTESAQVMHTSVANVSDLAAIFQLVYILLALPTGRWLDRRFPSALTAGALFTGLGGLLRVLNPYSFPFQLLAQTIVAVGQPLVLNGITKLAALHFPPEERATAISVGSASIFLGILLAMFSGPLLYAQGGLPLVLWVQALFALVAMIWAILAARTRPAYTVAEEPQGLGWLRGDRFMWRLAILLFLGFGIFIALSTWMQTILAFFHVGDTESGDLLALMTFTGILGSALLPPLVSSRNARRGMILLSLVVTGLGLFAVAWLHEPLWLALWFALSGFFLLANLPIVLDWAERHAGSGRQGSAVGFLMLAGMTGGLVLVLLDQAVIGSPYASLGVLLIAVVVALILSLGLPHRVEARTGLVEEPESA